MRHRTRRSVLRSMALLPLLGLRWQTAGALTAELPTDEDVRRLLMRRIDEERQSLGIVIGLVGAARNRVVAYGARSTADPRPPDASLLFNVGSISKLFTALLLTDAVRRGELRLEDPLKLHLPRGTKIPDFEDRPITLIDLVTHTSGLPVMPDDAPPESDQAAYARYSREQLFAFLAGYRLSVAPGSRWLYSNLSAVLIVEALTHRTRQSLASLLQSRVLQPMGLSSTYLSIDTAPRSRVIPGHDLDLRELPLEPASVLAGYGGMYSSARDLMKFVAAFMSYEHTSLNPAMTAMLKTRRPIVTYAGEQALGPQIFGDGDDVQIGHSGSTSGHAVSLTWTPGRFGVVALSNAAPPVTDLSAHLLDARVPLAAPMRSVSVDVTTLARYVGRYNGGSGMVFVVALEGQGLTFENPGFAPKIGIVPESEGVFTVPRIGARVVFEGAAPAPPHTVYIDLAGTRYTGRRMAE